MSSRCRKRWCAAALRTNPIGVWSEGRSEFPRWETATLTLPGSWLADSKVHLTVACGARERHSSSDLVFERHADAAQHCRRCPTHNETW